MKQYTPHSSMRVEATCPDCGFRKNVVISNLYRRGIGCVCQDGVSFPNKFVCNVLQQLNIQFQPEYYDDWSENRKYDIYVSSNKLIIENHGMQHYGDCNLHSKARTLKEEQDNDLFKYTLAINNGITNYVVLDCRYSQKEWIKASIMNSKLPSLLGFHEYDVDWDAALLYAMTSLVKTSAELFNEGHHVAEIAKIIGRSRSSVWKWLIAATQLELCNYNPKTETTLVNSKQIRCIETGVTFESVRKAAQFIGQSSTSIVNCLKEKTSQAGGYHWEYV